MQLSTTLGIACPESLEAKYKTILKKMKTKNHSGRHRISPVNSCFDEITKITAQQILELRAFLVSKAKQQNIIFLILYDFVKADSVYGSFFLFHISLSRYASNILFSMLHTENTDGTWCICVAVR